MKKKALLLTGFLFLVGWTGDDCSSGGGGGNAGSGGGGAAFDVGGGPATGGSSGTGSPGTGGSGDGGSSSGEACPRKQHAPTAWTGGSFVTRVPAGAPGGYQQALTYDACREVSVLFSRGATATLPDPAPMELFEWDGDTWTAKCQTPPCSENAPSPRWGAGFAYDSSRGVSVVLGGVTTDENGLGKRLCDNWSWDGTAWTEEGGCQADGPKLDRTREASAWRAASFGRHGVALLEETDAADKHVRIWKWDGSSWTRLCTGACESHVPSVLAGRGGVAYDSRRDKIVVMGMNPSAPDFATPAEKLTMWEYDPTDDAWTELCTSASCRATLPASRLDPAVVYDPDHAGVFMYGGLVPNPPGGVVGDVFFWDGSGWVASAPGPARSFMAIDYDLARQRFVIVDKVFVEGLAYPTETDEYF